MSVPQAILLGLSFVIFVYVWVAIIRPEKF